MYKNRKDGEWYPKPKQKRLLEAAITPGVDKTITAMCKEAHVAVKSYYNWYSKDEGFRKAWQKIWEVGIDRYMPSIVAAQVKKAHDGSTLAARFLADLSGRMQKKIDVTSGGQPLPTNTIIVREIVEDAQTQRE